MLFFIKKLKTINIGSYAGWFQQACAAIAAFLTLPIYIKYMGIGPAGQWLTFQSLFAIAGLSDFGFSFVASRQTAMCLGKDLTHNKTDESELKSGWEGVSQVFDTTKRANYLSCVLTLLLLMTWQIYSAIGHAGEVSENMGGKWTLCGLSLAVLLKLSNRPYAAILDGSGLLHITRFTAGVQMLFIAGGSCILAIISGEINYLVAWAVVMSLIESLILRRFLNNRTGITKVTGDSPKGWNLRSVAALAFPLGIVNLGGFLISAIQLPMIAAILGPAAVAPYYVAQRIAQFFNVAVMQFVYPSLPIFTKSMAAGKYKDAKKIFLKTTRIVQICTFLGVILFVSFLPHVSSIVFKVEPLEIKMIVLIAVDMLFFNISLIYGHFVLASGKNPIWLWVLAAGMLNVISLYIFLPKFGVIAIPVTSIIVGMMTIYTANIFYGRILKQSLTREEI